MRKEKSIIVTNRDLLRRFKELREKLMKDEVESVLVRQKNGSFLRIILIPGKSSFEELVKKINNQKLNLS